MSLPKENSEKMRGTAAAFLAPAWQQIALGAILVKNQVSQETNSDPSPNEKMHSLQLENLQLHQEIDRLKDLLQQERFLNSKLNHLCSNVKNQNEKDQNKLENIDLERLLNHYFQSIPAQVIYRSPSAWSSFLWLNVGSSSNQALEREIIAKNSPVVVGSSLIGVVDYVGRHQCRVRLITDPCLNPSVRAVRKDKDRIVYLAKGELQGSSKSFWRSSGASLKGIGFNYDFSDEYGPARDLRDGTLSKNNKEPSGPILKVDDLLITTGMDGVFPAGLHVAKVTSIYPLKEGDYYYELEAMPTAGNLNDLSIVFIMPPLGYDPADQPAAF